MTDKTTLAELAAGHQTIWRTLFDAGGAAYLDRQPDENGGQAAAEQERRLLEMLAACWPDLERHLQAEEQTLVPRLMTALGDRVGPLASMLRQHREIRLCMADLLAPVLSKAADPARSSRLRQLLSLLDDHLRQEKYILLPLAATIQSAGGGPEG